MKEILSYPKYSFKEFIPIIFRVNVKSITDISRFFISKTILPFIFVIKLLIHLSLFSILLNKNKKIEASLQLIPMKLIPRMKLISLQLKPMIGTV